MTCGYRNRIYDMYLDARDRPLGPATLADLQGQAPYIQRLIREHFPPGREATILDLGCGYGAIIHFARERGYRNIKGVDRSPQQVRAAKTLGIEGVDQADVMDALAGEPDASLECVISFDLIEHFSRDELIPFVDEVLRVLRPGGRWIVHTVNAESPFGMRIRYGDLTHELAFTRTSVAQVLFSSGFSQVNSYEDQPVVHGLKSLARWVLWKWFRALLRVYLVSETGDIGNALLSQNFLVIAVK